MHEDNDNNKKDGESEWILGGNRSVGSLWRVTARRKRRVMVVSDERRGKQYRDEGERGRESGGVD